MDSISTIKEQVKNCIFVIEINTKEKTYYIWVRGEFMFWDANTVYNSSIFGIYVGNNSLKVKEYEKQLIENGYIDFKEIISGR